MCIKVSVNWMLDTMKCSRGKPLGCTVYNLKIRANHERIALTPTTKGNFKGNLWNLRKLSDVYFFRWNQRFQRCAEIEWMLIRDPWPSRKSLLLFWKSTESNSCGSRHLYCTFLLVRSQIWTLAVARILKARPGLLEVLTISSKLHPEKDLVALTKTGLIQLNPASPESKKNIYLH